MNSKNDAGTSRAMLAPSASPEPAHDRVGPQRRLAQRLGKPVDVGDPILIRISLNCGSEEVYRKFHGYPRGWDYFDRVKANMRDLARRKLETGARTLVGISLIADERNMADIVAAAEEIRSVIDDAGLGIDYVIARPVMNYEHFDQPWARLKDGTKRRALDLVTEGGEAWQIFDDLGIPPVLIKDSFDEPPPPESYSSGTDCLSYGLYGEIRHNEAYSQPARRSCSKRLTCEDVTGFRGCE